MEERIKRLLPSLDERQKRLFLANEAISYGHGGISLVSRISGMSRTTITKAVAELERGEKLGTESVETEQEGIWLKIIILILRIQSVK